MKLLLPLLSLFVTVTATAVPLTPTTRLSPDEGAGRPLATAVSSGVRRGAPARANDVAVDVPYTVTFNQTDKLNDFTVIDANGDGKTWKYNNKEACCSYNSKMAMDDWLITRPIRFEAATAYTFTALVRCADAETVERMEGFAGTSPTVEAMTIPVVEKTEVTALKPNYATVEGSFTITASGNYYIGIHGCSDADQFTLFVQSITIESLGNASIPSAVTDLSVKPDPMGEKKVTVSFKAPATDDEGGNLTNVDFVEIEREGTKVKTFENVLPGGECTFTDVVDNIGTVTYTVTPIIGSNRGTSLSAKVYVGIAAPQTPAGLTLVETETDGIVTLSWDAVCVNEYGHEMDPSLVTYSIASTIDPETVIASGVTGTSHTFRAVGERYQTFAEYYLTATTEAGSSEPAISPVIAAGKPYSLPMELRVDNNYYLTHNIYIEGDWSIAPLSTDLDEDGFVLRLTAQNGVLDVIQSGKVAIPADARNPIFTFHYYTWKTAAAGPSLDVVYATINGERLEGAVYPLGESDGWRTATIPLDAYKGSSILVGFEVETKPLAGGMSYYPLFDGFTVKDPYANDLELKSYFIPTHIKAGNEAEITATVRNVGANDATAFDVVLRRDGEAVAKQTVDILEAGAKTALSFAQIPGVNWAENVVYTIAVEYAADENVADNVSEEHNVTILFPAYPVPTDVTYQLQSDESVLLAWEAPELSSEPETITEGFESEQPFAINDVTDWTFIDVDNSRTYAFGGGDTFPGQFSPMAYILFDNSYFDGNPDYAAHSGDKYIGSFAATSGVNDDWGISPILSGDAQTISLYASSFNNKYGLETFELLYTDKAEGYTTEDFTLIERSVVPVTWKKYSFNLPQGARHFAIRCTSEDKFFFMVDDVTFTIAPQTERFVITGYNIYCGGELLNEAPVVETTYSLDSTVSPADCRVSAVYAVGESCLSEAAKENAGIGIVDAETVSISTAANTILVGGATEGSVVSVYTPVGALAARATVDASGKAVLNVASGLYAVRVGTITAKVLVL